MAAWKRNESVLRLQREIALANVIVGFEILDCRGVDDLAFVDDSGVAGEPEAEMHVLLRDQNRSTRATPFPQQLADPLHDDRCQPLPPLLPHQPPPLSH